MINTKNFYWITVEFYDDQNDNYKTDEGFMIAESMIEVTQYVTEKMYDSIRNLHIEEVVWDCGQYIIIPECYQYFKKVIKENNEY